LNRKGEAGNKESHKLADNFLESSAMSKLSRNYDEVSISSTFYAQVFLYKSTLCSFSPVTFWLWPKKKHFNTKNAWVKCWWNWPKVLEDFNCFACLFIQWFSHIYNASKTFPIAADPQSCIESIERITNR
jgi:hypothetical protein